MHDHLPRTAPEQLIGLNNKPAWFLDLGRTTRLLALHYSETGLHLLNGIPAPLTLGTPLHLPSLNHASTALTCLVKTKIA